MFKPGNKDKTINVKEKSNYDIGQTPPHIRSRTVSGVITVKGKTMFFSHVENSSALNNAADTKAVDLNTPLSQTIIHPQMDARSPRGSVDISEIRRDKEWKEAEAAANKKESSGCNCFGSK